MSNLVILQGPDANHVFPLERESQLIGRQPDCAICVDDLAVSRHHARVFRHQGGFYVEDVGSRGGTFVNGRQITTATLLRDNDALQVGPYVFGLREDADAGIELPPRITSQVSALSSNFTLFAQNPAQKLQVVLEITQNLSRTLELEALLGKLLEQLLRLFPQADRGMVLLQEPRRLVTRDRKGREDATHPFSRTLVQKALDEGVGILSEDLGTDQKIAKTETLLALKLCSLMCVPLICQGRRLGIIQLDSTRAGRIFRSEDLELLTAVALQVAVVLENAALHVEQLREERRRQELALAREIQQGFLPVGFEPLGPSSFDLFADVNPALEVSGDLYDFFALPDGRLAFLVGDVSGKGVPAALFMMAVRTLCRHLIPSTIGPAEMMARLNDALAADNPSTMFVTLLQGFYEPKTGRLNFCSAGHPSPLLRRADGSVETLQTPSGRLLGIPGGSLHLEDIDIFLGPGETFILYTDGFTEAHTADQSSMFEVKRLCDALAGPELARASLEKSAQAATAAVQRFAAAREQQDDQTLLLLRRHGK